MDLMRCPDPKAYERAGSRSGDREFRTGMIRYSAAKSLPRSASTV
jgi:hypothetical protein